MESDMPTTPGVTTRSAASLHLTYLAAFFRPKWWPVEPGQHDAEGTRMQHHAHLLRDLLDQVL